MNKNFSFVTKSRLTVFALCLVILLGIPATTGFVNAQEASSTDTTVVSDASSTPVDTTVSTSTDTTATPTDTTVVSDSTTTPTGTSVSTSSDATTTNTNTQTAAAVLSTDKADYHPGDLVTIFGNFFSPLQDFILKVFGYGPDGISDYTESTQTVSSDNNGTFSGSYGLDNLYRPFYDVVASDLSGNTVAQTYFRDSAIGTYDQCSNDTGTGYTSGDTGCRWINGNLNGNNSTYQEGDSTVQRVWVEGYAPGSSHTLTFHYGTTKAGKHAYDFLTSWDASENWITVADRCQDITGCATASDNTFAIPHDSNGSGQFESDFATRNFVIRGGTITAASNPSIVSGTYAGDSDTSITVTFTVDPTGTGPMCSTSGNGNNAVTSCGIAIWFGAHIAKTSEWFGFNGTTGAGSINGSPYHVQLASEDGSSIGNRDNQMQSSAIINSSIITIHKVTSNGDSTTSFRFNTTGTGYAGFSLVGGGQNAQSVNPGSYTVNETVPVNWSNTGLTCTASGTGSSATPNLANHSVAITIGSAGGAAIDCTYTNTFTKLSPTISTTLSNLGPVTPGTQVHDSSALSGATSNAGGTVTYTVYTDNACTQGAQDAGTKTVTNASVPDSNNITFNTPGTFYWQASYSGDTNNNAAKSTCTSETLVVSKVSPTIATTLSSGPVAIGVNVHDASVLSGATSDAGGTVTYHAYAGSNTCSGTDLLNSTQTVTNGIVPNSADISFANAGTYSFQAVYSGDSKNNGATSVCSTEQLVVNKNAPSIGTTLSASSVDVGTSVHDSSAITGATSDAGGSVTYTVYSDNACTQNAQDGGTKTVTNGIVPDSDAIAFNTAGDYYWKAVYSGDSNNNGATSNCTEEHLVVNKVTPTISTTPSDGGVIGVTLNDTATLTGGFSPTGSVTFTLYAPSDATCSAAPVYTDTDASAPYATNPGFVSNAVGTYHWKAHYAGDANNNSADSACADEAVVVTKATPTLATTIHDANHAAVTSVDLGSTVHDSAAISGGYSPTGNVDFTFYPNATCSTDTGSSAGSVALSGGVADPSNSEGPLNAGSYSFKAHYAGDANNNSADADCEPLTVNKANLDITTTIHDSNHSATTTVGLGTVVHDTANVTGQIGNINPTGAVTFQFFSSPDCTTGATSVDNTGADGNAVRSADSSPLSAGAYSYQASIADDSNYTGKTSVCEPLTVNKAQLTVTTAVHDASHADITNTSIATGTITHDTATVTGGVDGFQVPTPTFTLTNGYTDSCSNGSAVANDGTEGSAVKSAVSSALAAGSYAYAASVAGDSNYIGASSDCEPFKVVDAKISIGNDGVNEINHPHTFTGHVDVNDGTGFVNAPDGTEIDFAIASGPGHLSAPSCTTTGGTGSCSVTDTSSVAGTDKVNATVTNITVDGVSLTRTTDSLAGDSGSATKKWVDANITISPLTATNPISTAHTFTVTVTQIPGDATPATTADITTNVDPTPDLQNVTTCGPSVAFIGDVATCTITINSSVPGVFTAGATTTLTVGGVSLTRGTDGTANNSGAAKKTYEAGELDITKVVDGLDTVVNGTSISKDFTVTVAGPSYPSGHDIVFHLVNGVLQAPATVGLYPLIPGDYTVTEADAGTSWSEAVGTSPVSVTANATSTDTVTNTYVPGSLEVTKALNLNSYQFASTLNTNFTVTVSGPSYPSGDILTFHVVNGALTDSPQTLNNLIPGSYSVVETDPGIAWTVTNGSSNVTVDPNTIDKDTVSNALKLPNTNITLTPNTFETAPGENVILTITDTNNGQVPISSPSVQLLANNVLTVPQPTYVSGDTNSNGIMDVGETWTWTWQGTISVDTVFTVNGIGTDPLGNPVNGPTYSTETTSQTIKVIGTTRTLGFWQTHTSFTTSIFTTQLGSSLPIGTAPHKGILTTNAQVFGGFYAPIAKTTTGVKRTPSDQARITLLQQLLAAKLNCAAFGCSSTTLAKIATADADYAAGNKAAIMNDVSILDAFNNSGDTFAIPAGLPATGKATPKNSTSIANLSFWDTP